MNILPILKFESDFDVLDKIGEGKFGKVFRVARRGTGEIWAAKRMQCRKASEKLRIREELDILRLLDHPNLLKLLSAYEDTETFIQVVEYLPGGELFERIIESADEMTELEIANFIRQICRGCSYLCQYRVVHLDLKPENIVCTSPKGFDIKIVDFGMARRLQSDKVTCVMQGTPEFVSPEVINFEPISLTTDMWSVGIITYVLLSGLSPFLGDNNQETYNNITSCNYTFDEPEFDNITMHAKDFISKLLKTNQEERLNADEALTHNWLSDVRLITPPSTPSTVARRNRLKSMMARLRWQKCTMVALACAKFRRHSIPQ